MDRWQMFIASSSKGRKYAEAVKRLIDAEFKAQFRTHICFLWNLAFEEGRSFLDTLEQIPSKYNCGLAVFTADDQKGDLFAPRDNVVLEFGLFLGAFGRKRSFLLIEDRDDISIPTDYKGIVETRFTTVNKESNEEYDNAVQSACTKVVEGLRRQPVYRRADALERIERNWRQACENEEIQLFTLYGLCDRQSAPERTEQHVYYLWADARVGSSIQVRMADDGVQNSAGREPLWHVEFDNRPNGFPGNVAIRPNRRCVLSALPNRFQRLKFSARIPSNYKTLMPDALSEVSIGVRVVDALTTHWAYCHPSSDESELKRTCGDCWQVIDIPLHDSNRWKVFWADGNYRYADRNPDFSQILAIVVELGSAGTTRPGDGAGVVELKGFVLE